MRHLASSVVVALFLLAGAAAASLAEESEGERVGALVTIHFAAESCAVVWPEVKAVFEGSPLEGWDRKRPAILAQPTRSWSEVECEREDTDDGGVLAVRVLLTLKGTPEGLRAEDVFRAQIRRLEMHLAKRFEAERRAHEVEKVRLEQRQQALVEQIGAVNPEGALPWPLSAATFFETLLQRRHDLRSRLGDLGVEEKTLRARREVLQARGTAVASVVAVERRVLEKSWGTILRARELVLTEERTLMEQGKGHPIDVAAAEESLARARLEQTVALDDFGASPTRVRWGVLRAAITDVDADLAALAASRTELEKLGTSLDARIGARRKDLLAVTRAEEELRVLGDRILDLQQAHLSAPPRVSVLRLD